MSICINCEKYKNNEHCIDNIEYCEYQLAEHDKKIRTDAYNKGATDMEKAKQIIIDSLLKEIEHTRAEVIDELLDISWHSIDLKDFRREVMKLKEQK